MFSVPLECSGRLSVLQNSGFRKQINMQDQTSFLVLKQEAFRERSLEQNE